jgi:hypothetical protein
MNDEFLLVFDLIVFYPTEQFELWFSLREANIASRGSAGAKTTDCFPATTGGKRLRPK